jgi:glycosyltransferase involved in cell wall biosynthesis
MIIGGSRAVEEHYRSLGVPPERRCHIYYGPNADRFDPAEHDGRSLRAELDIAPETPLVGQVAFFYRYVHGPWASAQTVGRDLKGHDLLVRAARLIRDVRPDVQFAFVGGPLGTRGHDVIADTRALADELGVLDAIHFLGHRQDIPGALAAFDVSVQCSRSENLGGTIESLLMKRPTVATAVGGMPEAVTDGETGLLAEPDDPEALARAILRLFAEPELGARLAAEGRRRMIAGFTSRTTIDDLDSLFQGLLAGTGGGGDWDGEAPSLVQVGAHWEKTSAARAQRF